MPHVAASKQIAVIHPALNVTPDFRLGTNKTVTQWRGEVREQGRVQFLELGPQDPLDELWLARVKNLDRSLSVRWELPSNRPIQAIENQIKIKRPLPAGLDLMSKPSFWQADLTGLRLHKKQVCVN